MFGKKNNGILFYSTSLVGSSHIKKGTVCQDANKAVMLKNGWCIAAVADGVGSARHSEIASSIAVNSIIDYCSKNIDVKSEIDLIEDILRKAYRYAEDTIEKYVEEKKDSIYDYDTTLSVVIYDGSTVIYGHSGDGGIVGLLTDGKYVKITNPQKAEDGICVIPLRAGESAWEFGKCDGEFASVLLATDGVYDTFFPYLLKGQSNEVYVPLIRYFMDNNALEMTPKTVSGIEKSRIDFLSGEAYEPVTDDKTIMVVVNADIKPSFQEEDYYKEPNWDELQLEWNKKAYPHLYKE